MKSKIIVCTSLLYFLTRKSICSNNIAWSPNNGSSISLWYHRWISNTPPLRQRVQGTYENATISSIWDHGPQNIMEEVKFIRLGLDPLNNDKHYWKGNPNSLFITKSVLYILKQSLPNPFHHSWIWKQKIPNKIKIFLWLCATSYKPLHAPLLHCPRIHLHYL